MRMSIFTEFLKDTIDVFCCYDCLSYSIIVGLKKLIFYFYKIEKTMWRNIITITKLFCDPFSPETISIRIFVEHAYLFRNVCRSNQSCTSRKLLLPVDPEYLPRSLPCSKLRFCRWQEEIRSCI